MSYALKPENVLDAMQHEVGIVLSDPSQGDNFANDFTFYDIFPFKIDSGTNLVRWMGGEFTVSFWWVPYLSVLLYGAFIIIGQQVMKSREPFNFQKILILWNFSLFVFTFSGALRVIPHLLYGIYVNDTTYFFCRAGAAGIWSWPTCALDVSSCWFEALATI